MRGLNFLQLYDNVIFPQDWYVYVLYKCLSVCKFKLEKEIKFKMSLNREGKAGTVLDKPSWISNMELSRESSFYSLDFLHRTQTLPCLNPAKQDQLLLKFIYFYISLFYFIIYFLCTCSCGIYFTVFFFCIFAPVESRDICHCNEIPQFNWLVVCHTNRIFFDS